MELVITSKSDPRLLSRMDSHYSQPKGFVGRSICYAIMHEGVYYGHIVAGSATKHLPGRNKFLGVTVKDIETVINNVFFSMSPAADKYPERNFTTRCVRLFTRIAPLDWFVKYGNDVVGFETLIEKPRTGELYRRAGWEEVGTTKGLTCKRVAGKGTDSWSGRRVWNKSTDALRPKAVLCYKL